MRLLFMYPSSTDCIALVEHSYSGRYTPCVENLSMAKHLGLRYDYSHFLWTAQTPTAVKALRPEDSFAQSLCRSVSLLFPPDPDVWLQETLHIVLFRVIVLSHAAGSFRLRLRNRRSNTSHRRVTIIECLCLAVAVRSSLCLRLSTLQQTHPASLDMTWLISLKFMGSLLDCSYTKRRRRTLRIVSYL